jgi:predicted ATPase
MPGYILTGSPGAGKTAVLRLLEIGGYVVVEEAATDVIALENALGREEPWSDHGFIDKVITLQRQRQNSVRAAEGSSSSRCPRARCLTESHWSSRPSIKSRWVSSPETGHASGA